jgi:hypothetical protein
MKHTTKSAAAIEPTVRASPSLSLLRHDEERMPGLFFFCIMSRSSQDLPERERSSTDLLDEESCRRGAAPVCIYENH